MAGTLRELILAAHNINMANLIDINHTAAYQKTWMGGHMTEKLLKKVEEALRAAIIPPGSDTPAKW